ncbi:MAG: DUF2723 domain-containing protein [Blastocatellia bacterium]|nr:DUF2723 domain-containing protein [Blastocatellia bacterium]
MVKVEDHTGSKFKLLQSEKAVPVCAGLVFAASLALYSLTLAPTVTLVDSGELIVAARGLGVAHPPGFPLYVLLAHAATYLPVGDVANRVNFASAIFAALAAAMLTLLTAEILLTPPRRKETRRKALRSGRRKEDAETRRRGDAAKNTETEAPLSPARLAVPALVAGLLLTVSRTLWSYGTIAEVYTLNTLLILVVFFLMFRWRRRNLEAEAGRYKLTQGPEKQGSRGAGEQRSRGEEKHPCSSAPLLLYGAAFVFGLALGVHHVTVGLMIVALAALVYRTEGLKFFTGRRLIYAALFAMAGLAVYVYLPLAASRSPVMNWGDPQTLERFWWHVSGRQYQVFFSLSLSRMAGQFGEFLRFAGREFGPWWVPVVHVLAVTGIVSLFRRDRTAFWVLALVTASDLLYALNYEIAEDKDAYYLPTFFTMALAAGVGAERLMRVTGKGRLSKKRNLYAKLLRAWAALVLALVVVLALATNLPYNDRSRYFIAHDYVNNILGTVESRGLLLTLDWQVYSPMLYVLEIENHRRDVVAIDVNHLRRSWYFDYLKRTYPELIERSRDKVDAFLEDLRSWEQNPELYNRDTTLNRRINERFYDMIIDFVTEHIKSAPVYITQDIAVNSSGQDSELTRALSSTYQFVPQGLVFRLASGTEYHEPVGRELVTRGLADGTLRFEDDDVVKQKVLPVYVNMIVHRGRYEAAHNRHREAIEFYKQALALAPDFAFARQSLGISEDSLRDGEKGKQ